MKSHKTPVDPEVGLLFELAKIREALGVGNKPMLSELPGICSEIVAAGKASSTQNVQLAGALEELMRASRHFLRDTSNKANRDWLVSAGRDADKILYPGNFLECLSCGYVAPVPEAISTLSVDCPVCGKAFRPLPS